MWRQGAVSTGLRLTPGSVGGQTPKESEHPHAPVPASQLPLYLPWLQSGRGAERLKPWTASVHLPLLLFTNKSFWATYLSLLYLSFFGCPVEMLARMVPTSQSREVFRIDVNHTSHC